MSFKNYGFIKINNEKWQKIKFDEVIYIKSYGKKSSVLYFTETKWIICNCPIIKLQKRLPCYFERVDKSYIVNVTYVHLVDFNLKKIHLNNNVTIDFVDRYINNIERYLMYNKKPT